MEEVEDKKQDPFKGNRFFVEYSTARYLRVHFASENDALELLPRFATNFLARKMAVLFDIHGCEKMTWTKDTWPSALEKLEDTEAVMLQNFRAAHTATSVRTSLTRPDSPPPVGQSGDVHTEWVSIIPSTPPPSQYREASKLAAKELKIQRAAWIRLRKMEFQGVLDNEPWGITKALVLAHDEHFLPVFAKLYKDVMGPKGEEEADDVWEARVKAAVATPVHRCVPGWSAPYVQIADIYKVLKRDDPDIVDYSVAFWDDKSAYLHMQNPRAVASAEGGRGDVSMGK